MLYFRGRQAVVSMQMDAGAAQAWKLLTDTEHWLGWGVSIRAVEFPERYITGNSTGRVQTVLGIWLPFTITEFRQGEYWCWRIGNMPATGHTVVPVGESVCTVAFSVPWWGLPYTLVCYIALRRIRTLLGT